MQCWRSILVSVVSAICCASVAHADAPLPGSAWLADYARAKSRAAELNKPLLVHFYAGWCIPCRRMERETLRTGDMARRLKTAFVGVKLDADRNGPLMKQLGVRSLPADVVIAPDGTKSVLSVGYQTKGQYLARLDAVGRRFGNAPPSTAKPAAPQIARKPAASEEELDGLDGYCPVSLWNWREWKKGDRLITAKHKGIRYRFASALDRDAFRGDPEKYAPRLLGCDPVVLYNADKAERGTTKFGAYFDGKLYLFKSAENRTTFKRQPIRYTRTRHVLKPNATKKK